jgi:methionyl-tRNA formyltransferase
VPLAGECETLAERKEYMMLDQNYVVAAIRPWNVVQYHATKSSLPGAWHLITDPDALTVEHLASIQPRYIFFPHWTRKVPAEIIDCYECVCFHETDVPYGRGGSPLQNLIERGHKDTVVTALRMVEDFDAGPVYAKRPLSLLGLAEEIYVRSAAIVFEMIAEIAANEPTPVPQIGEPTVFIRRKPEQSAIPQGAQTLAALFDHIRMLDAEQYPHAFLEYANFRFAFTRPALRTGRIEATVSITQRSQERNNQ